MEWQKINEFRYVAELNGFELISYEKNKAANPEADFLHMNFIGNGSFGFEIYKDDIQYHRQKVNSIEEGKEKAENFVRNYITKYTPNLMKFKVYHKKLKVYGKPCIGLPFEHVSEDIPAAAGVKYIYFHNKEMDEKMTSLNTAKLDLSNSEDRQEMKIEFINS